MYKEKHTTPDRAEEVAASYNNSDQNITSAGILGVNKDVSLDNPMAYMQVSDNGLTKNNFNRLKQFTGLDTETLANILSVTTRTLQRKKPSEKFRQSISEKMLELADLYVFGIKIFGDKSKFQSWLNDKIAALNYSKPIEYIYSSYGRSYIRQLLGRIEYGVYS